MDLVCNCEGAGLMHVLSDKLPAYPCDIPEEILRLEALHSLESDSGKRYSARGRFGDEQWKASINSLHELNRYRTVLPLIIYAEEAIS